MNIRFTLILTFIITALVTLQSCSDNPAGPDFSAAPPPYDISSAVRDSTTPDGLTFYVIREGYGAFQVVSQDQVRVRFTGRTTDGKIFDSSYRNGFTGARTFQNLTPIPITVGFSTVQPLVDGFRRSIIGMRPGEKRTAIVPPSLGYGDAREGTNGFDLRNDTLIFDIELVEIPSLN